MHYLQARLTNSQPDSSLYHQLGLVSLQHLKSTTVACRNIMQVTYLICTIILCVVYHRVATGFSGDLPGRLSDGHFNAFLDHKTHIPSPQRVLEGHIFRNCSSSHFILGRHNDRSMHDVLVTLMRLQQLTMICSEYLIAMLNLCWVWPTQDIRISKSKNLLYLFNFNSHNNLCGIIGTIAGDCHWWQTSSMTICCWILVVSSL